MSAPPPYLAACVQLRSTTDVTANLDRAEDAIARAARYGARLVATPENTPFLGPPAAKLAAAAADGGAAAGRFARLARSLGIHVLVGSVAEPIDAARCHNTSLLYGPDGLVASYRKLHLFDVDLPGGPRFEESAHVVAGDQVVVADTPLGRIGLSVCYDVRFPELFAACVAQGAQILTVPSAFTVPTGQAHWHVLLRARAIETQCYVLAPAQEGPHDPAGARASYGHSLIVDPWGTVLADAADGEGLALAEIDLARVEAVRRAMPVGDHRRRWSGGLGE